MFGYTFPYKIYLYELSTTEMCTCPFHGKIGQMPSLNPTIDEHIIHITLTKNNIVLIYMVKMFQHILQSNTD